MPRLRSKRAVTRGWGTGLARKSDKHSAVDPGAGEFAALRVFLNYRREETSGHAGRLFEKGSLGQVPLWTGVVYPLAGERSARLGNQAHFAAPDTR